MVAKAPSAKEPPSSSRVRMAASSVSPAPKNEPTARDLAAVRAAYGQHATQGSVANDLPRTGHRREVAYWKGRPELAARVLGGLDHCPRVLDSRRDGLLAENMHTAL